MRSYTYTPSYTLMSCTGTSFAFTLTCNLTSDYIIRSITPLQTTATENRLCAWTHIAPKDTGSLETLYQAGKDEWNWLQQLDTTGYNN
jgi:hypothetical protein